MKVLFKEVYKRSGIVNNKVEYSLINREVYLDEKLVESLIRSGFANVKRSGKDEKLYYEI